MYSVDDLSYVNVSPFEQAKRESLVRWPILKFFAFCVFKNNITVLCSADDVKRQNELKT